MIEIIVIEKEEFKAIIERAILECLQTQRLINQERQQPEFLSIDQAAKYLQIAKQTIYSYTSKNIIPHLKKGKKLYFKQSELKAWLDKGTVN